MASLALFLTAPVFSVLPQTDSRRDHGVLISAAAYLVRLQSVEAETLKNEFEEEFMVLLDKREKQSYSALPLAERREYITRYWHARDPDSSTSIKAKITAAPRPLSPPR
jgi:hypothetical protein